MSTDKSTPESQPGTDTESDSPPRNQPEDARRDGSDDPLPNRGVSDLTFGDLGDLHDDPYTLYDRAVLQNPDTCPNCHHRLGRQWEIGNSKRTERLSSFVTYIHREKPWQLPEDERDHLDDRYYQQESFPDRVTTEPTGRKYEAAKRTVVCQNCGHELHPPKEFPGALYTGEAEGIPYIDPDDREAGTEDDPRPMREAVRAAFTLSDTLAEYSIPHHANVLIETVRAGKLSNSLAKYDDLVFRKAVADAINAVRMFDLDDPFVRGLDGG